MFIIPENPQNGHIINAGINVFKYENNRWYMIPNTVHPEVTLFSQIPTGAVIYVSSSSAPDGYIECSGQELYREIYPELFATIGTLYGEGNGTTTFNLPDLRGEFLRGWDNGRGIDVDRTLGSFQEDAFKAHNHTVSILDTVGLLSGDSTNSWDTGGTGSHTVRTWNTSTTGTTETRPRNIALLACIKY